MAVVLLSRQEINDVFAQWADRAINYLPPVALGIGVFLLSLLVAGIARRSAKQALTRASGDERAGNAWGSIIRYVVILLGIVAGLSVAGVSLSALMVAVGAIGFGLAFAMQDIIANFASGLILLTTHPFARGDTVEINGVEGEVKQVSIRSTKLKTFDGLKVEVPNTEALTNNITVYSHHPSRRFDVGVGIGYDDDISGAVETARQAASGVDDVLDDPSPEVYVTDLGGSSVNLNVRFWVERSDRRTMRGIRGDVTRAVKEALVEDGYDIPYPIRDVFVHEPDEAR